MTTININGNKLNFEINGAGFPVVLLHGFSDDLNYWNFISSDLEKYFTVLKIDFRGHGKSELGDKKITIDLLTDDVVELLKTLYIEKCYLIGFSIGGSVAIDIAIKNKNLVKKLVLVSTYGKIDENTKEKFKLINKSMKKSYENYYNTIIDYVLPKDVINENSEKLCTICDEKSKSADCEDLRKILYGVKQFDNLDKVRQINAKTLIIAGLDDTLVLPEQSKLLNEKINNSQLEICEGVKHNVFIKPQTERLKKMIIEFLRK